MPRAADYHRSCFIWHPVCDGNRMRTAMSLSVLLLATVWLCAQQIPAGTLLPVMLDNTIDSDKSKPGEAVTAKLMQEVPLPDGAKIKRDSKVFGHVVAVSPASSGQGAKISVQFDKVDIEKQTVPVSVGLRALASMETVALAKEPINASSGYGTTAWDLNMRQIGGQVAFNGAKIVKSQTGQVVGKVPQPGAVLAIPMANPARGCGGPTGNTAEQAFWVFSTDACGIYDGKDMTFVSGIAGVNSGQIVLESPKTVEVRGGSGWLLQVN